MIITVDLFSVPLPLTPKCANFRGLITDNAPQVGNSVRDNVVGGVVRQFSKRLDSRAWAIGSIVYVLKIGLSRHFREYSNKGKRSMCLLWWSLFVVPIFPDLVITSMHYSYRSCKILPLYGLNNIIQENVT